MSDMLSQLLKIRMKLISDQLSPALIVGSENLQHVQQTLQSRFTHSHSSDSCQAHSEQTNDCQSIELAYSTFQSPKATSSKEAPLVILHGLFGRKKNWESLAKILCKSGRKVITVDARNHGESSHVPQMDYWSMSRDVEKLLQKLSISRAMMLGHSMGGKTAMCLAHSRPHLVEKLIVEDICPDSAKSAIASAFPQYIAAMKDVDFGPQVDTLAEARIAADKQLKNIFKEDFIRAFIVTNVRLGKSGKPEWHVNLGALENHIEKIMSFPEISTKYDGPTLFLGGKNSVQLQECSEEKIHRLFPKAKVEMIEGAGHWVHNDKPWEFIDAVNAFLEDTS